MPALLILLSLYALPGELPVPSEAQNKRIERAIAGLRGDQRERAVRELALIGRPALRAIVARLNEADPAERVLLLTSTMRLHSSTRTSETGPMDMIPALFTRTSIFPKRAIA